MKKQWKICKNPDCRKKFYREERHHQRQWNRITFHSRECQTKHYNDGRREKRRHKFPNAINFQLLHDCCNRYTEEARKRLKDQIIVYSHEDMTQEELISLIPSMRG